MKPVSPEELGAICGLVNATLERELGSGAFKQAFLVHRAGNPFALKIARVSAKNPERFKREAEALKRCAHPSIATLHESSTASIGSEHFWLSLEEYLAHGTLTTRLASGPLPPEEIRRLGKILVGAIDHMRGHSFVHRDIKPDNILFRDETTPVLTDFGIVRILTEPSITADYVGQGPGTPMYAAPEQLLNDKPLIDWRTDQFGLALVLGHAALGRHPFQPPGGDQTDAIQSVAERKVLAAEVVTEFQRMGLGGLPRALSPWPFQRYQSADDMLKALGEGN